MIDLEYLIVHGRNPRVHGNGFLQIDLEIDGETGSERVHIFGHPALPRQKQPTPIHDHRFGFVSTVLRGRLTNVVYDIVPTDRVTHRVYTPSPRRGEDTLLVSTDEVGELMVWNSKTMLSGQDYVMRARQFHETLANELTVTHMRKMEQVSAVPRVLCPIDKEPDNDFERYDLSASALWDIVRDAFA